MCAAKARHRQTENHARPRLIDIMRPTPTAARMHTIWLLHTRTDLTFYFHADLHFTVLTPFVTIAFCQLS